MGIYEDDLEIPYKKGDKIFRVGYINPPTYIVEEAYSQIIITQCGKKLIRYTVRPLGYYNKWIKWSMSVKTM